MKPLNKQKLLFMTDAEVGRTNSIYWVILRFGLLTPSLFLLERNALNADFNGGQRHNINKTFTTLKCPKLSLECAI